MNEPTRGLRHEVVKHPAPWLVFSSVAREVSELGTLPRWRAITGANHRELTAAVVAFNRGDLDGLAVTFGAGVGFRLRGVKTIVLVGTADANVMAQACARAPGATTVLL